jgi:hypothetical protein
MSRLGLRCRDVRTREAGIQDIHHRVQPRDVELVRRDYYASGGWETFLSYEDPGQDILIGLLRLRRLSGSGKDRQPDIQGVRQPLMPLQNVPTCARRLQCCNAPLLRLRAQLAYVCFAVNDTARKGFRLAA